MTRSIGQQGKKTRSFDGLRKPALVLRTCARLTLGAYFAAALDEPCQQTGILVVNIDSVSTERTDPRPRAVVLRLPSGGSGRKAVIRHSLTPHYCSNGISLGAISPSSGNAAVPDCLPKKSTLFAVTSRLVRFCPSWPCQGRAWNRPSTYTC